MTDTLAGVHPTLVSKLQQVYAAMACLGHPMRPTDGCRTAMQQTALYAQGRFGNAGAIVTDCDGLKRLSNHQPKADGFGHAVDSCFSGADPYLDQHPQRDLIWDTFGHCCKTVGLVWGVTLANGTVDRPHAELAA